MAYVEEQLLPRVHAELVKLHGDKDLVKEIGAFLGLHKADPDTVWGGKPTVEVVPPKAEDAADEPAVVRRATSPAQPYVSVAEPKADPKPDEPRSGTARPHHG